LVCRVYRCIKQITEPSNTTRIHLFAHSSEHVPISCNFGTVRFNFVKKNCWCENLSGLYNECKVHEIL